MLPRTKKKGKDSQSRGNHQPTSAAPVSAEPAADPASLGRTKEFELPERIPKVWLDDLKDAIKEKSITKLIITTALSSSLLAAALTTAGNWYLERTKARIAWQHDLAMAELPQYTTLTKEVGLLDKQLQNTIKLIKVRMDPKNSGQRYAIEHLPDQLNTLEDQIAKVKENVKSFVSAEGTATRKSIEDLINPFGDEVAKSRETLNTPQTLKNLLSSCENFGTQHVDSIRNRIKLAMDGLTKQPD